MNELDLFLGLFLKAIIMAAIGILVPKIVSWVTIHEQEVQRQLDEQKNWAIKQFIVMAVQAAEQSGLKGLIQDLGPVKKAWVIQQVQAWADARQIPINVSEIELGIEAALNQGLHKSDPTYPVVPPTPTNLRPV